MSREGGSREECRGDCIVIPFPPWLSLSSLLLHLTSFEASVLLLRFLILLLPQCFFTARVYHSLLFFAAFMSMPPLHPPLVLLSIGPS